MGGCRLEVILCVDLVRVSDETGILFSPRRCLRSGRLSWPEVDIPNWMTLEKAQREQWRRLQRTWLLWVVGYG